MGKDTEIPEIKDMDEFCRQVNTFPNWSACRIKSRDLSPDVVKTLKQWLIDNPPVLLSGKIVDVVRIGDENNTDKDENK